MVSNVLESTTPTPTSDLHLIYNQNYNNKATGIWKYCHREKLRPYGTGTYASNIVGSAVVQHKGKLITIKINPDENLQYEPQPGHPRETNVSSIDLATGNISHLPPTKFPRSRPLAEILNGSIYVFGGVGTSAGVERYCWEIRNSINIFRIRFDINVFIFPFFLKFRFDFERNEWTDVHPMTTPRWCPAHVVALGRLYVFGGLINAGRKEPLNSVEYYNPKTDNWRTVAPMLRQKSSATAYATKGFIYVIGGNSARGRIPLSSIERYDPDEDSWITVS